MKESRGDKERWSKFCPKCGKKTDELFDSLCRACFTKEIKLIDAEKLAIPIRVNMCEICGSYFKGKGAGKERTSIEEVVTDAIRKEIREQYGHEQECKVRVEGLVGNELKDAENQVIVSLRVKAEIKGVEIEERGEIEVSLKRGACERCGRITGGYYAGIVQIRADDRIPADEELTMAEEIAYSGLGDADFIPKETKLKEGLDIYVSSMECGRRVSRQIVKKLGGGFSESRKLYGRKDGRNVYRVSFSVRLPAFKEGEKVEIGDKVFSVVKVRKEKGIECVDVATGERTFLKKKETNKARRHFFFLEKRKPVLKEKK
ncbi:MAG: NMD3-related protein [Halobacteriota archaeon]